MKERKSIKWRIRNIFLRSRIYRPVTSFIPWEQCALLKCINDPVYGQAYISNEQLCAALSSMKKLGEITRLRWFVPSERNIWILNEKL